MPSQSFGTFIDVEFDIPLSFGFFFDNESIVSGAVKVLDITVRVLATADTSGRNYPLNNPSKMIETASVTLVDMVFCAVSPLLVTADASAASLVLYPDNGLPVRGLMQSLIGGYFSSMLFS